MGKSSSDLSDLSPYYFRRGMARKRRNKALQEAVLLSRITNLALARFLLKSIRFDAVGNLLSLASACFRSRTAVAQSAFHQGTGTRRGRHVDFGIAMVAARRTASVNWATKVSILFEKCLHYNFLAECIPVGSME